MSFKKYFERKSVALIQAESQRGDLKRTLSALNLVSLGIGCIIGTGIFVMTGQAAASFAGPAIIISFLLAGTCCAFAAFCYAELASMLPVSGSAYSYAYASMGELAAWFMGWLLLLEYGIAGSTVAVGWSGYLTSFLKDFDIIIPPTLSAATGTMVTLANGETVEAIFNLPATLGLLAITTLLTLGVKESVTVNNVIVLIKVTVILLFIGVGMLYINPDNWHPFLPENTGEYGHFGWSGILRGAGFIFFAYVGFEAVSTAAQEAKNPQRDVPIGIIGSLIVCTVLYILVSLVLTGIVKYDTLNVPDPIAVAVDSIHLPWLKFVVKVGAIAGLSSVMLVLMYGQTRIFYAIARDGLLPKRFSAVHHKFKTPYVNTIFVGVVSSIVAGFTPIEQLGDLVNLGTLMAFTIICITTLHMRKYAPDLHRPFNLKYPRLIPILGILFCGVLISTLWKTFLMLIPYFAVGMVIYFTYGYRHSRLRDLPEELVEKPE